MGLQLPHPQFKSGWHLTNKNVSLESNETFFLCYSFGTCLFDEHYLLKAYYNILSGNFLSFTG